MVESSIQFKDITTLIHCLLYFFKSKGRNYDPSFVRRPKPPQRQCPSVRDSHTLSQPTFLSHRLLSLLVLMLTVLSIVGHDNRHMPDSLPTTSLPPE